MLLLLLPAGGLRADRRGWQDLNNRQGPTKARIKKLKARSNLVKQGMPSYNSALSLILLMGSNYTNHEPRSQYQ
jgi:hypothetical protein